MQPLEYRALLLETLNRLDMSRVQALADAFSAAYEGGHTIYTMGNGGSAASASHAAGDFLKGASFGLDKRFKMICLNDNLPSLMAIEEPLKNYLQTGDLVVGLSGSGNSENVLRAMQWAKANGATTAGLTGYSGGKLAQLVDIHVHSDANDMEVAEDVHMAVFNMVKKSMMAKYMGDTPSMGATYDARVK